MPFIFHLTKPSNSVRQRLSSTAASALPSSSLSCSLGRTEAPAPPGVYRGGLGLRRPSVRPASPYYSVTSPEQKSREE